MSAGNEITIALEAWADEWTYDDAETGPGLLRTGLLDPFYTFSPEWTAVWEQCWAEYDRLENIRRAAAVPRLPWQDGREEVRQGWNDHRAGQFRHMDDNPKLWKFAPLSIHLDRYRKTNTQDRILSWNTTLDNWKTFRKWSNDADFVASLSSAQSSSMQVLLGWWDSSEESLQTLMKTMIAHLETLRGHPCCINPTREEYLLEIADKIETDTSFHHAACYKLFCFEFHPRAWEPFESSVLRDLQDTRQRVVGYWTCYLFSHVINQNRDVAPTSYPIPVRNDNGWYDEVVLKEDPFYLWDTYTQETVLVEDLIRESNQQPPRCPDYVCISHTWGRWRKPTATVVPGVKWPVPENERYDVRDLPTMLAKVGCRYIWFDLFCIPQSGDDNRKDIEISRQAAIFRKCVRCIAWVNHCDTWDGDENGLKWLGLRYLKSTHRSPPAWIDLELERLATLAGGPVGLMQFQKGIYGPVGWFTSLWTLQEAVLCPELEVYSRHWERLAAPATLTTLMVFLEDAPYLCWTPDPHSFSFADHVEYEEMLEKVRPQTKFDELFPYGSASLVGIAHHSGLPRILQTLAPMSIFSEIGFREYGDVCAPAIMSAIGATDWYTNAQQSFQNLVFDEYPLEFLQEAARKIGSSFFDTYPRADKMVVIPGVTGPGGLTASASMLPISPSSRKFLRTNLFDDFSAERCDHESVAGWVLNVDGSVRISAAAIMAHSRMELRETPPERGSMSLQCFSHGVSSGAAMLGDVFEAAQAQVTVGEYLEGIQALTVNDLDCEHGLVNTLVHLSDGCMMYAVVLCNDGGSQQGIILAETIQQDPAGTKRLVKVGCYIIEDLHLNEARGPNSSAVDWLVL